MPFKQNGHQNAPSSTTWLEGLNRAILDSALDCIITMDAKGVVREFNPAAERTFGFTRTQAVGRELAELIIPPSLRERHRQGLAHYLATGEGPVLGRRIEIAAQRADESELLVELAITAYRIEGEPVFTAYLRDITERVRTERRRAAQYGVASLLAGSLSLQEIGDQILETIAASGDWVCGAIWLNDEKAGTLHCGVTWQAASDARTEFIELTRSMQFPYQKGLPGRVAASQKATWIPDVTRDTNFQRRAVAERSGLRGAFGGPLFAEGKVQGVLELFSPLVARPDEDLVQLMESLGSQIGLFIHRRRTAQELQAEKTAAETANAAKDRFLAKLSHELRTPLTPILMWAGDAAQQPDVPESLAEGLRMVCRNIELEARLIDDLLDLTRITRGKLRLDLRLTEAHEILQHSIEIVQNDLETRQVRLERTLQAANGKLRADGARLQQIFWNVLRNAAKFTPRGGIISVRTWNPNAAHLAIEIHDTGIGVEAEYLEKIFDAFEQGGGQKEGLGLGLAITKAVTEMHGGTISATSEGRGKGATFLITLPTAA
ncbi:MAG: ATP-binding protein [Chthoniobacterales bacterium]